jgi:23S rRNA pseudouridine955/2504/2580 synthase
MVATRRSVLLTLHAALRDRTLRKRYDVLVHGAWPRRLATVQLPLEKYVLKSGERRVRVTRDGKPSRTDFTVVESHAGGTWLQARLHTGRTHQIRVHAAASGYPVIGDTKYATAVQQSEAARAGVYRLCLHAREVVFEHRGARLRLEAPLPADFEAAWQVWCGTPAQA